MSDACGPNVFSCWESAMATVRVGSATSATLCAIGLMSSIGVAAGIGGAGVMSGLATVGGVVGDGTVAVLAALGAVPGAIGTVVGRATATPPWPPELPSGSRMRPGEELSHDGFFGSGRLDIEDVAERYAERSGLQFPVSCRRENRL